MISNINIEILKQRGFEKELVYSVSRSSGPGGQNVNKVNSKVMLRFNINESEILTDDEKARLLIFSSSQITTEGEIVIASQSARTQIRNKELSIERFYLFLANALHIPKERKATKPTKASKEKRLNKKKRLSEIKKQRRSPDL